MKISLIPLFLLFYLIVNAQEIVDSTEIKPMANVDYAVLSGNFVDHGKNMPTYEFSFYVPEGSTDVQIRIELIIDDIVHAPAEKWHPKHAMDVDVRGGLNDLQINHNWKFPTSGLEAVGDIILPFHVTVDRTGWIPVSIGIHGRPGHTTLVLWIGRTYLAEFDLAGFPSKTSNGNVICHLESNDANLENKVIGLVANAKLEGHEFPEMRTEIQEDMVTMKWWVMNSGGLTFYHIYEVDGIGGRRQISTVNDANPKFSEMEVTVGMPAEGKWIEVDMDLPSGEKVVGEFHPGTK